MMKRQRLCHSFCISLSVVIALLVLCVAGCGPAGSASLSGKVTFDGQPIAEGNIRLFAEQGTASQGGASAIANGSYEIPKRAGLIAGKYSVVITATRAATEAEAKAMAAADDESGDKEEVSQKEEGGEGDEPAAKTAPAQPAVRKVQYIPKQYNQTTTLTAELTAGANTLDFDLKSK